MFEKGQPAPMARSDQGEGCVMGAMGAMSVALAAIAAGIDALLDVEIGDCDDREVAAGMLELERQTRRLPAAMLRLVRAADERRFGRREGCRNTATLLQRVLQLSPGEARARVAAAEDLAVGVDRDGVRLEPAQQRRRAASLVLRPDGSADLRARLTPEGAAIVQATLLPLAAPRPPDASGRDERTAPQRLHDGLVEACRRLLSVGQVRAEGGMPVTIIATVPLADLVAGVDAQPTKLGAAAIAGKESARTRLAREGVDAPVARTQYGGRLSIGQVLRLAGEAEVIPVVVDGRGVPLYEGRAKRCATRGQTMALIARDGGCSFPGCDHPPAWCQRHHWRHDAITGGAAGVRVAA